MKSLVLLVLLSVGIAQASKLPNWVTACYRDDPDFDACAVKNGQASIPRLILGERKLQLPVLEPMLITEIRLDKKATNLGLDVTLSNVSLIGLKDTEVKKFSVDFKKQHVTLALFEPHLEFHTTYDVAGKILVLPLTGHGPGNITLKGTTIFYDVDYTLVKQNGKDHMSLSNDKLTFEPTRMYVKLDNLFNGDKLIGDQMNQFMNDNWRELKKEVGPAISVAFGTVMTQIFSVLASNVPYDDIVPLRPKP